MTAICALKCGTPRCVKPPTMCWNFVDVRHILVDVSIFTSCVALPHLGSVPLFVYPQTGKVLKKNPSAKAYLRKK